MPSRRALLRTGGAAALAALAGCQSVSAPRRDATQPESSGAGEYRLDADAIAPARVADSATVGVASPDLHELVADAAERDGRVDLRSDGSADRDETLALGAFEYLRFDGSTYEPTASFAGFAEEASYRYEAVAVNDSEVDDGGDVAAYGDLTAAQQRVADELLGTGSYTVGHHEEKPEAVRVFDRTAFLRADGETYRVQAAIGDHGPHYMLTLDPADPSEGDQVVTVPGDPPEADWTDVLVAGLDTGGGGVEKSSNDEAFGEYLGRVDYVATATRVLDVSVTETVQ
ncbi:hypothetical protein [Halobacterium jilantaiense]|uniref:DUF7979 domain-containing protein n=1 Tax=Halobacterium jilantaiense TaxID=355548 RepID=A0A1I0PJ13_9EURY|nr:hypothetical protein [Halobacterium jilantaiense]SEW14371.1 hypothetical protein SAMN04487945_1730 [Halobacterium jilantaiense]